MKKFQGKLTYANVISTLCLFLLLGVVPPLPPRNCRNTASAPNS